MALIFNGMPERVAHERRMEATATAIYEDLGLVAPGSPGRDHPLPGGE